jgi:hypothetical protein
MCHVHRGVSFYSRVFVCAAVLVFAFAAWSPAAQAGTAAPCVEPQNCAQPPGATGGEGQLPSQGVAGQKASGGNGSQQGSNGSEASPGSAGTAAVETGEGNGGSLPFTGYPMIVLVWVVLALVVAGIVIRLGLVPRRRRLAEDRTH